MRLAHYQTYYKFGSIPARNSKYAEINMNIVVLSKDSYSEWVVRNSLYWLSPVSGWVLEEEDHKWMIDLEINDRKVIQELYRLLNDYSLRESLMKQTELLRESISLTVLSALQQRLDAHE